MKKKIISLLLLCVLLIPNFAFAEENINTIKVNDENTVRKENEKITPKIFAENVTLNDESQQFLEEYNIDIYKELLKFSDDNNSNINYRSLENDTMQDKEVYVGNLNDDILALKNAAEANNFTEEQIGAYVDGLLKNETEVIEDNNEISLRSAPDRNEGNSYGCGFEALSQQSFSQMTTRVKLPSVNINNSREIHYLFVSPGNSNDLFDFGLMKGQNNWVGFYLLDKKNHPGMTNMNQFSLNRSVRDGEMLYYNIYIGTDGYINCKILNNNNFSDVIASKRIWLNYGSKNSIAFNKQITMTFDRYTRYGGKINDARFSDSYLYNDRGNYRFENKVNNSRYGAFGDTRVSGSRYYTNYRFSSNTDYVDINLPKN